MKKLIVNKKYNNKKLNTFILDNFQNLNSNTFFKALRKKDIKVNNIRVSENKTIHTGDEITIYITDELLFSNQNLKIEKIYEDENILIVNKPKNISVTKDHYHSSTLTELIKNSYGQNLEPCHRLDRNTSGLVIFAKSKIALNILLEKFKNKEIKKYYKATVYGIPNPKHKLLKSYLFKDNKKSLVYISNTKKKGYLEIITEYTVISSNLHNNTSVLDILLHTGRTHQIRAHLAFIGYPIIGDSKYGKNEINKKFKKTTQELYSYKIEFKFKNDSGILNYLNNKIITKE